MSNAIAPTENINKSQAKIMKTSTKLITTASVITILAFLLTPTIWPLPPQFQNIPPKLTPWFLGLGVYESIGFGIALATLMFGIGWIKTNTPVQYHKRLILLTIFACWSAGNWLTHDHAHIMTEERNFTRLLVIEYSYHVTIMISGVLSIYIGQNLIKDIFQPKNNQ